MNDAVKQSVLVQAREGEATLQEEALDNASGR